MVDSPVQPFIDRWKNSGAAERANYQLFLSELCDVLGVPRPDPTKPNDDDNAYVFERSVTFHHPDGSKTTGRIDLYKRGSFVLEAKQGVEKQEQEAALSEIGKTKAKAAKKGTATRGSALWDEAMLKAQGQADQYARSLPASEGRPPLLIVVDVGHSLELYSEFTCTGGAYVPFPDPRSHRISIDQLIDPDVREKLRLAWIDPKALDPARRTARVTREIAEKLGLLAQSLEKSKHSPEAVATFLMRALFTMFAEDVELLPKDSFITLLKSLQGQSEQFVPMVEELWRTMKTGGFSTVLRKKIALFNGGLFENVTALPLTEDQFELLIEASKADWRDVEPAIFGTLLERALNPIERHKLGAHYTPRAYVERLVVPTIVEPLRAEWDAVKAAAVTFGRLGKAKEAVAEVQRFHTRLCEIRVLDPACGSGNFLYVTLEHLKRLEGEVLNALDRLGHKQDVFQTAGITVDPHQLLGLEVNPRAAAIAELVLWIGYLQWHFRTRGKVSPPEPIIKNFHNIVCRDAVIEWDRTEPALDGHGEHITRWDGRTMKMNPATCEAVPDDAARVPVLSYVNPRPAIWPQAEFIVGNPPFIGKGKVRDALGDGYVETLREMYPDVPDSADFVMYWWDKAALLLREGKATRFGFITTNSLKQTFNRRVVEQQLGPDKISLNFAIPDHPWVDSEDGAAVRIAMTVGVAGGGSGRLLEVIEETESGEDAAKVTLRERTGLIHANLTIGADVGGTVPLESNDDLASTGLILGSRGFVLTRAEADALKAANIECTKLIFPLRNGDDVNGIGRDFYVIDTNGWNEEKLRSSVPEIYQRLRDMVYPERQENRDPKLRKNWWLFRRSNEQVRAAISGLKRFIATVETSKHRMFTFIEGTIKPEHILIVFGFDDAYYLGVLSSHIHVVWALATGGTLEDRPRYNKTRCFDPFPFPIAAEDQEKRIRKLAEALDAHRKRQQTQHPDLTLTDMYNVVEKLRAGTSLMWFAYTTFAVDESEQQKYVLELGGVRWSEADFCRGWEIDGRTGSGKTASAVVPIIHALKLNRPEMGVLALDSKGDLSEPLHAIAQHLGREADVRQLEVRPDDALPDWQPAYTMNILADPSIPFSTYAKLLVDVATAAGQKGGQAFFKNAAQVAIQNGLATLAALNLPVTIDNCYYLVTDNMELDKRVAELVELAAPKNGHLVDYYREFVKQPPEQLSGIRSTVFNYLQPYTTPDIAQIFCSADPNFDVKELDLGRLMTVKIPQKYQTERKYISLLLKVLFYLHALRRYDLPANIRDKKNLIVLVLDEAQETVLVSEDGISDYNVVDKIRGARATTINSTQSPTSYIPPMGNREKADVFLLNLGNKIYFTAADKLASEMLAASIGKRTIKKRTYGRSGGKSSTSWTEQDEYWMKPHELRSLPKHTAIIKHCEQRHRRVYLRPSSFTKPKPPDQREEFLSNANQHQKTKSG